MKKQLLIFCIWIVLMAVSFFIYDSLADKSVEPLSEISVTVTVVQTDNEFFTEKSNFPDSFYDAKINLDSKISSDFYSVRYNNMDFNNPIFGKDQILLMNHFFMNCDTLLKEIIIFLLG